ncbi:MAG: hypothetical protein V8Q32_00580 [Anaerotignum faecicola]
MIFIWSRVIIRSAFIIIQNRDVSLCFYRGAKGSRCPASAVGESEKINVSCGEILKIDSNGNITRDSFCDDHLKASYYNSYAAHPWGWRCGYDMAYIKDYYGADYIEELKSVAGAFGYCADDVEHLGGRLYTGRTGGLFLWM